MSRRVEDNLFRMHRADELMQRAIGLTEATRPHPNPRVGAIVMNPAGEVLSERAHLEAGAEHAEAAALAQAGSDARGSTLIVTLEPCAHHGRSPPGRTAANAWLLERLIPTHELPGKASPNFATQASRLSPGSKRRQWSQTTPAISITERPVGHW